MLSDLWRNKKGTVPRWIDAIVNILRAFSLLRVSMATSSTGNEVHFVFGGRGGGEGGKLLLSNNLAQL